MITHKRKPEYTVNPIFVNRWSPRAMSGEEISDDELFSLFEAAKWAPSSFNNQPWRFLYAKRKTSQWDHFFSLLSDGNKLWANKAAVLIVMISKKTMDYNDKPARTHTFDTGAAWENLALQGSLNGLVVHGMEGFDYEKAKVELKIPDEYKVEAMAAIGRPGKKTELPVDLQMREFPSDRKKIKAIVFEGEFMDYHFD
jgi:nitroreductase